jgi:hypothetical protein
MVTWQAKQEDEDRQGLQSADAWDYRSRFGANTLGLYHDRKKLFTSFDSSGRFLYGPCRQDDQMPIEPHRRGGKHMARARTSVKHQPWLATVRQQQVVTQLAPKALVATGEPLPVKVDGCQDAATAHVIEGPLGSI